MNQAVAAARAVLFDFDFTLADSSEGIVVCMNHALARLGLPPASADAIRRTIGLDLHTALGILAGEGWTPGRHGRRAWGSSRFCRARRRRGCSPGIP